MARKVSARKSRRLLPLKRRVRVPEIEHGLLPVQVFNPNSFDSQFASLHSTLSAQDTSRNARMDTQDNELKLIKLQTEKTNGRVTVLEGKWKVAAGWVAGAAAIAAAAVNLLLHFWK